MNTLVDAIFPANIASVLRDFLINKPKLIGIIGSYVSQYVPAELQSVIMKLFETVYGVSDSLNSIAKENGITISTTPTSNIITYTEDTQMPEDTTNSNYVENNQQKVDEIIEVFEERTTGLDVPFPRIELTESQSLYTPEELTEYLANKTIENLTELGYITTEEDAEELKNILEGKEDINFALIDRINKNAGDSFNYRFWGTFGSTKEALYAWSSGEDTVYTKTEEISKLTRLYNADYSPYFGVDFKVTEVEPNKYAITFDDEEAERNEDEDVISNALAELTSFYIKKSYKDKFRTIPCTKLINATNNQRLFFACPKKEGNLTFYINSKRVELPSFEIDLGYVDIYGSPIMYNVYYTVSGYNSNSVLFEVKKGGMI